MILPDSNRIVVPYDFSEESVRALGVALEQASQPSDVYVVHVLPELSPVEPGLMFKQISNESRASHVRESLDEQFAKEKSLGVHFDVRFGDPGQRIADHADVLGAELIVISSHGRRGLSRLLIGSVTERVLRLAHCPVLVLRGQ